MNFCCFTPTHSSCNSSGLEHSTDFLLFCPNPFASCDRPIGGFFHISGFCSNLLFVQFFRLGAFACFSVFLPQSALCSILPAWSICLIFYCFAPTHSLYNSSDLEHSPDFCCFAPTYSLFNSSGLEHLLVFCFFAPTHLLPVTDLLGDFSIFLLFRSN